VIVYNLTKVWENFILTMFKNFWEHKWKLQIDSESIEIKKWNNNYTMKFERTWIGWYQKNIWNLKLNLIIICD